MCTKERRCVDCCHFYFSPGHADYSDVTPGEGAVLKCAQNRWELDLFDSSEAEYRAAHRQAMTCGDFELVE